jgi:hypothetical protein
MPSRYPNAQDLILCLNEKDGPCTMIPPEVLTRKNGALGRDGDPRWALTPPTTGESEPPKARGREGSPK